jgi:photoactive yellow protein
MSSRTGTREPLIAEFDIRVTELNEQELDTQPFGIIRLDREGVVLSYNLYEESRARRRRENVIGKNFFAEVAPCTRVQEFYGNFLKGVAQRKLNATFGFVFPFPHGDRNVDISLYYKEKDDSIWVLIRG